MLDNKSLIKLWSNDEKRKAFISAYSDWGLWFETPELQLKWFRYQLPDETVLIAMEYQDVVFVGYSEGYQLGTTIRYYIQKKGTRFSPNSHSSVSAVADLLKYAKFGLVENAKKNSNEDAFITYSTSDKVNQRRKKLGLCNPDTEKSVTAKLPTDGKTEYSSDVSREGHCPRCDYELQNYGTFNVFDDCIEYPWECSSCGATGREHGIVCFDGHYVDLPSDSEEK